MNKQGSIRVTNMRVSMSPEFQPEDDEVVIVIDRTNPILGNKHILYRKNDFSEREKVIAAYKRDLEIDVANQGRMSIEIAEIAQRVKQGEKICLACWCKPSPCHGDVLVKKIFNLARG